MFLENGITYASEVTKSTTTDLARNIYKATGIKENLYKFNGDLGGTFYVGKETGKTYLFDKGNWFYLNSDGTMATNTTIDGCYLNESGVMTDTPAKKAKQAEAKSASNSDSESIGNSLTRNEAMNLIYNNDGKNIIKDKIKLEYY